MNHKKLRRLYPEKRVQVRRRSGRRRAFGARAPLAVPQGPNQRWSLDFPCRRAEQRSPPPHFLRSSMTSRANARAWW
jgi:hypothetical protein